MTAYYNENDPKTAAWLRELIKRGLIADGDVDDRSIAEVNPIDISGYTQCHFFAGIGGWSYALRLAEWPDDKPVWTGSCPCQPFSIAGNRKGITDERHLFPTWLKLIKACKPIAIFGEQVSSPDGLAWIDDVYNGLENENYSVGACDLCAPSIGAPHLRQRLYWFAKNRTKDPLVLEKRNCADRVGVSIRMANSNYKGSDSHGQETIFATFGERSYSSSFGEKGEKNIYWRNSDWITCADGRWRPIESGIEPLVDGVSAGMVRLRGYGNAIVPQIAAAFIKAASEEEGSAISGGKDA